MKRRTIFLVCLAMISVYGSYSQSGNDTVSSGSFLKYLKISGYVQSQYNHYLINDTLGATNFDYATYSGGQMVGRFSDNRFTLRRGRIGFAYEKNLAKAALQIDITERGVVAKEAYVKFTDPWLKSFSITTGIFNRPFGYELGFSSKDRPSPERSRVIQTIFPMERDLGVMLSFAMPQESKFHFLKIDAALMNGNAVNAETDPDKDWVGRFRIEKPLKSKFFNFSIGASIYRGSLRHVCNITQNSNEKRYIFDMKEMVDGSMGFDTIMSADAGLMGKKVDRSYNGIDLEFEINSFLGKTKIYSEYIYGQQPSVVYKRIDPFTWNTFSPTGPSLGISYPIYNSILPFDPMPVGQSIRFYDTFIRQFEGFEISLNHQIGKSKHEIIVKYDWYDPNTKISNEEIQWITFVDQYGSPMAYNYLSSADVKYTTLGIGWIFNVNENLKFTLYYENVKNEVTKIKARSYDLTGQSIDLGYYPHPGFEKDIKDDVITVRLQYSF